MKKAYWIARQTLTLHEEGLWNEEIFRFDPDWQAIVDTPDLRIYAFHPTNPARPAAVLVWLFVGPK